MKLVKIKIHNSFKPLLKGYHMHSLLTDLLINHQIQLTPVEHLKLSNEEHYYTTIRLPKQLISKYRHHKLSLIINEELKKYFKK